MEFLLRGFMEEGIEPPTNVLEQAVDFFDGIVGWLVLFGRKYVDGVRDFENLKNMAIEVAREELNKLGDREKAVLKAIANGCNSWSKVREYIAREHDFVMPKSTLSRIVSRLESLSIVKNFEFLDPIYREASKRLAIAKLV